jgi:hypothetical protein
MREPPRKAPKAPGHIVIVASAQRCQLLLTTCPPTSTNVFHSSSLRPCAIRAVHQCIEPRTLFVSTILALCLASFFSTVASLSRRGPHSVHAAPFRFPCAGRPVRADSPTQRRVAQHELPTRSALRSFRLHSGIVWCCASARGFLCARHTPSLNRGMPCDGVPARLAS